MAPTVLDAATREFAAAGLRGADLERIAADAGTDVDTVLRESGSVEALFDRVLAVSTEAVIRAVRFDPTDLPRFAGALFEAMQRDGSILRLSMWQVLERPDGNDEERRVVTAWLDAIAESGAGAVDPDAFGAAELLAYALALAKAELLAPRLLATGIADDADLPERRAHVEEAMRRLVGFHA